MTYYSANHYAIKAEKSATRAETAASQASQASGKITQLGFDGAMQDGVLVFTHAPSGVEVPYELLDDYEYELDLSYNSLEDLSGDVQMYVKNGNDTVTFVSALHRDSTSYATVDEMSSVMRFNADTGYRWLFKAAFKIAPNGTKVLLLYPVISTGGAGAGLEIGDIGFAPLGIDETQNKRRYLNGQVISQAQFVSFTTKVKNAILLYPSLSATEENWQTEVTNSALGQCGKFVIDDELGTIRLPKVVNIQGLQDLALMGSIKDESLPNITGETGGWVGGGTAGNNGALYTVAKANQSWGGSIASEVKSVAIDASLSSSTYQDNAPVQQEAIQYPYFIQVATGTEESVEVTREIELNNPFFLGMSQYFESEPKNASWLISNGSFHSGATYVSFYEWLLKIYNGTETVDGVSVKASTDTYDDYDYVINTTDTTFRLPLLDGSESLPSERYDDITLEASGSTFTAKANGIVGLGGSVAASGGYFSLNKFVNGQEVYADNAQYPSSGAGITTSIELSKDESVMYFYANATVSYFRFTYFKGNGSLYFYVGETIQDANVINASGVLTRVAELSDSYISSLGMSSNKYIDLTLGASGTEYIAPANGYVIFGRIVGDQQFVALTDVVTEIASVSISSGAHSPTVFIPIVKGRAFKATYSGTGSTLKFRFIYAEGEI